MIDRLQSVIVAVSSDFIPKLVYQYVTGDDSLDGFIRFSLTGESEDRGAGFL